MRSINFHSLFRKLLIICSILALGYLCIEIIFFTTVGQSGTRIAINFWEIQQRRTAFSDAKKQWETKEISHYQITVHNLNFRVNNLYTCSQIKDVLTVKNKIVINSSVLSLEGCRSVHNQLTVEAMLDRVEHELANINPLTSEIQIQFDPNFGFVSYYSQRKYTPLSFTVYSEHPTVLMFSDFLVLNEP